MSPRATASRTRPASFLQPTRSGSSELLCATGIDEVEVSSFVSAKWIPQLGDAAELFGSLSVRSSPMLSALVPNEKGMQGVLDVNAPSRPQAHQQNRLVHRRRRDVRPQEHQRLDRRNHRSLQARGRNSPIAKKSRSAATSPASSRVRSKGRSGRRPSRPSPQRLRDLGIDDLDLGDTIGAGTPDTINTLLRHIDDEIGIDSSGVITTLHLHDTFGRACRMRENCPRSRHHQLRRLRRGPRWLSIRQHSREACPREHLHRNLVRTIAAGFTTGVDLNALEAAAAFAREIVAKSRAGASGPSTGGAA